MRVAGVDVHTEDTRAGRADVLGVGRILQRKQAEIARPTVFVKIVRSVADSKQIAIYRIPLQVCDLQSVRFVIEALLEGVRGNIFKSPKWQQSSLPVLVLISRIFIEPVVPSKLSEPQIISLISYLSIAEMKLAYVLRFNILSIILAETSIFLSFRSL